MAGFRIGRGRDNRTSQQHPQQQQSYGRQAPPPGYGGGPGPQAGPQGAPPYGQQQWPQAGGGPAYGGQSGAGRQYGGHGGGHGGHGGHGEPEYFGEPHGGGQPPRPGRQGDPYANSPGHTQAFSIGEEPYAGDDRYTAAPAPPAGPRLPWKELLSGIVLRPADTFYRMRDYPVWGPALIVTFVYGLLALFGFDAAREDAINATLSTAIPYALTTAVAFVVGSLIMGAVTHTLARQLGGDGTWQPTVGLSMLIMSITDLPRLLFALFLGGENGLVQVLGWVTWVAAGALFTVMVSKSHDLPWPKALGASAIQLIALLSLLKLGTL
ncbi:Yip1 family protein [Streptomyces sp. NPDC095613]|uniref:Yip1 family protein n=1 Tax=Streptomyces sp. NPDC095613 TaxID=3155540 RepID=UPI00332BD86C